MLSFDLDDPNWEEEWEEEMSKLLSKIEEGEEIPECDRGITTRDLDALSDWPIGLEEFDYLIK